MTLHCEVYPCSHKLRFYFFIIMAITNVICWIPKLHFLMTLKGYASKCNSGTLFCALNDHFFPTLKYSDLHNGFSYVSCQICASFSSSMLFTMFTFELMRLRYERWCSSYLCLHNLCTNTNTHG